MSCDIMVRFNYIQQEQLMAMKTAYEEVMRERIEEFEMADSDEEYVELLEESMTDHEMFDEFMARIEDPDLIKIRVAMMQGRPLTPVDRIRMATSPQLALGPVELMTFDQLRDQITYRPPATVDRVQQAADARTRELVEMMTDEERKQLEDEELARQNDEAERQVVAVDPKVSMPPGRYTSTVQEVTSDANRWGEWGAIYAPSGTWNSVRVVAKNQFTEAQEQLLKATFENVANDELLKEVKADPRLLVSNGESLQILTDRLYVITSKSGVPRFCDRETGSVKTIIDMSYSQEQVEVSTFGSYDREFVAGSRQVRFTFDDGSKFTLSY